VVDALVAGRCTVMELGVEVHGLARGADWGTSMLHVWLQDALEARCYRHCCCGHIRCLGLCYRCMRCTRLHRPLDIGISRLRIYSASREFRCCAGCPSPSSSPDRRPLHADSARLPPVVPCLHRSP
jgi:hypothetical protein